MQFKINKNSGFTLIELLVVISIIALLSSIILVALNGARQKGIQAAALEFATANYHAFGANAYAYFNFNSQDLTDSAGVYNWTPAITGTLNTDYSFSQDTPEGGGYSLDILTAGFTDVASNATQVPKPFPYTLSFWFKLGSSFTGATTALIGSGPSGPFQVVIPNLSNMTVGASGSGVNYTFPVALQANQWTQATISFDNNASTPTIKLYINGDVAGSYTFTSAFPSGSWSSFRINGISGFGYLDDVGLYSQALSDSDIRNLYAIEAPAHGLAVK